MDAKPGAELRLRTQAVQMPMGHDAPRNGLVGSIHLSTTYTRDESYAYASDHVYGRADNPTLRQTEASVAAMERAWSAMLFGSGMSAAIAVIMALDRPSHVIATASMYYGLKRWLAGIGRFGHTIAFVDTTDLTALAASIDARPPDLVWIETPSNPLWRITDIAAVARLAHAVGAVVCVDSTVATPVFTRPIDYGADLVMHSATKYLNGHSDVSAGVLAAARPSDLWSRIAEARADQGTGLGAFDAWLLARGLRTLAIRVKAQAASAATLARRLVAHPAVAEVLYPGLPDHPDHAVALRQMTGGFGGMLSIRLANADAALAVAGRVRLWRCATSLGGVESLIEHRASMEGAGPFCPDDLLRLSVGIEDPDDLWADLDSALHGLGAVDAPDDPIRVSPTERGVAP
ncbi:PLP-dependent transferase [Siculibacillus lacustris]|uniref:PLP-dependent transferase n=1 Tax=Siculibacillus lacustris TaxID=1549641 RepID=A0A4Q9VH18_9HYPH|nr:PLP-dependent aspartate aminotransferase family protein [Siculibacillus lacustris]TBW33421.1 PLP-dependent transferase [Siculibacillus lacustris]